MKRKTLKQWVVFGRRGMRKRKYRDNYRLHEHEHQVILRDACALDCEEFTGTTLINSYPGRYDEYMLREALIRMRKQGLLKRNYKSRVFGTAYKVKDEIRAIAA